MPTQQNEAPVLVITGPTASGKSALAHAVALQTGAEIISADSRQIYRELTIGSAKPTPEMLEEAAYHFINEKTSPSLTAPEHSLQKHENASPRSRNATTPL